jgi:hypothetical protein
MSAEGPIRTDAGNQEGWGMVSRRALLKAGWTAPVILTVAPAVAFAASGSPSGGSTNPGGSTGPGGSNNPTTSTGNPTTSNQAPGGATSPAGVPEQSSQGPQPAKVNRGFTG